MNVQQAKKWLNMARKSGHAGAMSIFGNVLFEEGQTVRGLAFLTAALDRCNRRIVPGCRICRSGRSRSRRKTIGGLPWR